MYNIFNKEKQKMLSFLTKSINVSKQSKKKISYMNTNLRPLSKHIFNQDI